MQSVPDAQKTRDLMKYLGQRAGGPGRVYLVGGSSAVLVGWRTNTVDVDLKIHPEPPGIFEAIEQAKEDLSVSIEVAAPDDFLPALPAWETRSPYIETHGEVDFFHYDSYAQALAKLCRGHRRDLDDVQIMHRHGLLDCDVLLELFSAIEPGLIRYPQIEVPEFRERVHDAVSGFKRRQG